MPLKICYENIVKIVCNYHFLKKKSGMELWQWYCRNRRGSAHNFYNIFTTNFNWRVVIVGLKK